MEKIQIINNNRYISNGDVFILSYFIESKILHYCGTHVGEIAGNTITVEEYNTIEEIIVRVKEVGIILTLEQADEIIYRAEHKGVILSDEIKQEIMDYINGLME